MLSANDLCGRRIVAHLYRVLYPRGWLRTLSSPDAPSRRAGQPANRGV